MTTQYKDIKTEFEANPFTGEPSVAKNERAVIQSVKNLILTDVGEKPFQPDIGGNIRGLLFEPATPFTLKLIEERVQETIENYEPRVDLQSTDAIVDEDRNRIEVTLRFKIVSNPGTVETKIFLQRLT